MPEIRKKYIEELYRQGSDDLNNNIIEVFYKNRNEEVV